MTREKEITSQIEVEQLRDITVIKFGGTSVAEIEKVVEAVEMYQRDGGSVVVVLSAVSGVTNGLLKCCDALFAGDRNQYQDALSQALSNNQVIISRLSQNDQSLLFDKFYQLFGELGADLCSYKKYVGYENMFKDRIASYGERFSQEIFNVVARNHGLCTDVVNSLDIMKTDDKFLDAKPNFEEIKHRVSLEIMPILNKGRIPVLAGFIGATENGQITTLGRGGSDYTATILGWALNCREVVIFTDVDYIYDKDPNKYPDAEYYTVMSMAYADKLAKAGAKVLYPNTLDPLLGSNIVVRVRNTKNLACLGTLIINLFI